MKNILFYFNSLKPSGGIERVIVTLANKLCDDYKVTIIVKDNPISFYELNKEIQFISLDNELNFNMNSKLSRVFSAFFSVIKNTISLRRFLNKNKFDYYYLAHPLNVLEFHFSRGVNGDDTVITEHGSPDAYNSIYNIIKTKLYPKALVYIVPTSSDALYYKKMSFPVRHIPHFRSTLQYEKVMSNQNIALNIGRFTDVKQQFILLKIWNSLIKKKQIVNWKLFIVGEGELKNTFLEYIEENELQEYIFILPPRKDVEFYYKQASLFILTSKSEGFGMVLLEAVSFGIPCISYDCPSGPRDLITNNVDGILVPLFDEILLEEAVLKLTNSSDIRRQLGERCYEKSLEWSDLKIYQKWISIFK